MRRNKLKHKPRNFWCISNTSISLHLQSYIKKVKVYTIKSSVKPLIIQQAKKLGFFVNELTLKKFKYILIPKVEKERHHFSTFGNFSSTIFLQSKWIIQHTNYKDLLFITIINNIKVRYQISETIELIESK